MLQLGTKLFDRTRLSHCVVRIRRIVKPALLEKRGAAAMEFGMVVIPFFTVVLTSLYTSLGFFAQSILDSQTEVAARHLRTGHAQTDDGGWNQARYKTEVCKDLPFFMDCDRLFIDVRSADTLSELNMQMPAVAKQSASIASGPALSTLRYASDGRVVTSGNYVPPDKDKKSFVRLIYMWPMGVGPLGVGTQNLGRNTMLVSTSVFSAEPF